MNKSPTLTEFRQYYKACGRTIVEEAVSHDPYGDSLYSDEIAGWKLLENGSVIAYAPYLSIAYTELYEDENDGA